MKSCCDSRKYMQDPPETLKRWWCKHALWRSPMVICPANLHTMDVLAMDDARMEFFSYLENNKETENKTMVRLCVKGFLHAYFFQCRYSIVFSARISRVYCTFLGCLRTFFNSKYFYTHIEINKVCLECLVEQFYYNYCLGL